MEKEKEYRNHEMEGHRLYENEEMEESHRDPLSREKGCCGNVLKFKHTEIAHARGGKL